jgi:hypothetical protein
MPDLSAARRLSMLVAAVAGGVVTAMIVEILLARRGVELTSAWQGLLRGGRQMHAALAWWSITGIAFLASFVIAATMSRVSWLYFRSLRWLAAGALALALAIIADAVPLAPPEIASRHALALLAALLAATVMGGFGAFFAVRR